MSLFCVLHPAWRGRIRIHPRRRDDSSTRVANNEMPNDEDVECAVSVAEVVQFQCGGASEV